MGRRNQHTREQQRAMALDAAEQLIAREGLAGLSMRKVAQAMGYTVGNLYLLFANQDDLLATLNEHTGRAMLEFLEQAAARRREPLAQLKAVAVAYIEFAQSRPHRWRLMFEHQLPPEMWQRPQLDALQQALFELVRRHLAALHPQMKPQALHMAATALWSSVHGLCVLAVTGKLAWSGLKDARPLANLIVQSLVAGLRADAPD